MNKKDFENLKAAVEEMVEIERGECEPTRRYIICKEHEHEWVVFSTCIGTVELMVECVKCGAFGTVPEPTREEWCKPVDPPYRWRDSSRVIIRQLGDGTPYYVERKDNGIS